MSSRQKAGRRSLFAGVSFADLWRAANYRGRSGYSGLPAPLQVAYAGRFAAQAQPLASEASVGEEQRAQSFASWREAA